MTWLALRSPQTGAVSRPPPSRDQKPPDQFLLAGSLVLELNFPVAAPHPLRVLDISGTGDWPTRLSIRLEPPGLLSVSLQQGHVISRASVSIGPDHDGQDLRLSYSWDAPKRHGLLSLERLDEGELHQVAFPDPQPLPLALIARMTHPHPGKTDPDIAQNVSFLGVSDRIEPVGLIAGLARGTPVDTPVGPVAVEQLRPGDLVLTETAGPQPVRWIGSRETPALGRFQPIRLRAPYFSLARDIVVAPEQRVQIDTIEVEYLFGKDKVLAEAQHILNGTSALAHRVQRTVRMYHILLDRHAILTAAGCRLESLYIGTIGDDPALLRSTILRGLPGPDVPRHTRLARAVLRPFEAISLQSVARP